MSESEDNPRGNKPTNKPPKPKAKLTAQMEAVKWKPGQSGNPNGRPKKKPITELYEKILNDPKNMAVVEEAIIKALSRGQMAMVLQIREMTDRIEGKITQPIEAEISVSLADAIQSGRKRAADALAASKRAGK